jgi:hypothetical protein
MSDRHGNDLSGELRADGSFRPTRIPSLTVYAREIWGTKLSGLVIQGNHLRPTTS